MIETLMNWWKARSGDESSPSTPVARNSNQVPARPPRAAAPPRPGKADRRKSDRRKAGREQDKNVLIRNKFVREETGTHDTLTILDDSLVDSGEESGIDPYNTGAFDRSRNWDHRFRK